MAKKAKVVNVALLNSIATGAVTRVNQTNGKPLLDEGLILVNTADVVGDEAAVQITPAGVEYLKNANSPTEEVKGKPMYGIMKGIPIPPSNRGNRKGAGAPTVYNFAEMEVGDSFFVPNSDKPDAFKKMQSTVSAQNHKYSEPTGETESVEVTKRGKGNKAELDANGNKIKETVMRQKRKPIRKYVSRPITAGMVLGTWTAPEDGALIAREV